MQPPALTVVCQYVKDLSFESPQLLRYLQIDSPPREPFSMGVRVRPIAPGRFEVALVVKAAAYRNDVAGYILELTYAGIFNLTNFPPEQIEAILHIQAAELLFPFMRKTLANLLQANGLPFNAHRHSDFVAHYARHLENRQNDRRMG